MKEYKLYLIQIVNDSLDGDKQKLWLSNIKSCNDVPSLEDVANNLGKYLYDNGLLEAVIKKYNIYE